MLNQAKARDAVRYMTQVHADERRRMDDIAEYLRPWDTHTALRRLGAADQQTSRNFDRVAQLARLSHTPFINLVVDTYGQSLKVEGFYTKDNENSSAWRWWQRNRMPSRQTGLHRDALTYGTAYATVFPAAGDGVSIGVHSPRKMVTLYGDTLGLPGFEASSDEFPILALAFDRRHIRLIDEQAVYIFGIEHGPHHPELWNDPAYTTPDNLPLIETRPHNLGVTPVVRYQDRWMSDGEEQRGIVEHLLGLQDRIDLTNFEQGQTQHAAAFKQRYVVGWLPEDELQALKQSVSDTQFFEDPDVKVGQYEESDLTRYIESRQATVRDFAAVAQVPAQALGANAISNISADGLAALETSKDRKAAEIQTALGESHEQLLRLASYVAGDEAAAGDFDSEVAWAETSARSFAQTVDGLGKLSTMLGIPPEELLGDIPGWTKERVDRARRAMRGQTGAGLFNPADGL